MKLMQKALAIGLAAVAIPVPASAQFYLQPYDFTLNKPDFEAGLAMPGATEAERRAALTWNMRAALNVAALQCQFEPTLLTVTNYNAILLDHKDELKKAFDTVAAYYARTAKTKREGQTALDQFGTRTYASYATVSAQFGFCQTASSIGRDALFIAPGKLSDVAVQRMGELRNSLIPYGEQRFPRYIGRDFASLPRLDVICWDKKGEWVTRKCGDQNWPPAGTSGNNAAVAAR